MGRKRRNRHRRQSGRLTPDEGSNDESDSGDHRNHVKADRLGSHPVTLSRYTNYSPIHQSQPHRNTNRPRESLQDLANRHHRLNGHASASRCVDQSAFLIKSRRFKVRILQSIDQMFKQIHQWCPDEDSGADEMDWQPEAELLLPALAQRPMFANHISDSKGLSSDKLSTGVQDRTNAAPPSALLAMKVFGCIEFDAGSAQRMERAMDMDRFSSSLDGCRYVVRTFVGTWGAGNEAPRLRRQ